MRYQVRMHPTMDILVSSVGEVFIPANGTHKAHWTFGCTDKGGYLRVRINGKNYRVHRLVAETFIPNPENLPEIDHTSRNPSLNCVECLRWVSRSGNNRNTSSHDRVDARGGTHWYEDEKQYEKERYHRHKQSYLKRSTNLNKTHKCVLFSDGKRRWLLNSEALLLLAVPVKERIFKGD